MFSLQICILDILSNLIIKSFAGYGQFHNMTWEVVLRHSCIAKRIDAYFVVNPDIAMTKHRSMG